MSRNKSAQEELIWAQDRIYSLEQQLSAAEDFQEAPYTEPLERIATALEQIATALLRSENL